jgi:hypothetical protein
MRMAVDTSDPAGEILFQMIGEPVAQFDDGEGSGLELTMQKNAQFDVCEEIFAITRHLPALCGCFPFYHSLES